MYMYNIIFSRGRWSTAHKADDWTFWLQLFFSSPFHSIVGCGFIFAF
jgi:hypothetical protein